MSHFLVGVVVDVNLRQLLEVRDIVEYLLAPYDEHIEVPAYKRKCSCVGFEARCFAAEQEKPKWRARTEALYKKYGIDPFEEPSTGDFARESVVLKREYAAALDAAEAAHPNAGKPSATCDECKGTGEAESTYSPVAHWDWWSIGGRWAGWGTDYDFEKDERNYETCWLCKGTGKRDDDLGRSMRAENPDYTCNGCDGTGRKEKFSAAVDGDWNFARKKVDDLLALEGDEFGKALPFALVLPGGENGVSTWLQRARMGWWGLTSDEETPEEWQKKAREALEPHRGKYVVGVDCHI